MVRERKRRDDKDRHELAWNPDYGWQILRRCPNYIKAVDVFLRAAEKAGDQISLYAYKAVSLDEARFDGAKSPFRRVPSWSRPRRGSKSRLEVLRDQEESFDFPKVPNPKHRNYDGDVGARFFVVDTTSAHYSKFYEWYGDLILFPINPSCERPRASALSALWALYSVKVHGTPISEIAGTNENLINLSLTINTSFSRTMIEDDLRWFLNGKLSGHAPIKEKPRWSSEQFDSYLMLLDAVYPKGVKTQISHKVAGEQCAPSYVQRKVNRNRAIIDWAKDTRRYIETKLFPIFNKTEPSQKRKRRY